MSNTSNNNKPYNCPEEILYTICLAAWAFCRRFLNEFKAFMSDYTDTYVDDAIKHVNDAKALTAVKERNAERKRARIKLASSAKLNLKNFQDLKRYIVKVFPADQVETYINEAGAAFYERAADNNWTSVRSLIGAMKDFLEKYAGELATKVPTPVTDKFKTDIADCFNYSDVYFSIDREINMQTTEKNNANNAIYKALIAMLKDGQQIFRADKEMKRQFTFRYLLATVRKSGAAGFKGYIATADGLPLEGILVISSNKKYKATTEKDGRFHITKMEAGDYVFTFSKEDYQAIEKTYTIKAGITHNIDLTMQKEVILQAA